MISSVKMADNRNALPHTWRKAMVLACREKGMTFANIGHVAGCSGSRASQLYHRALRDVGVETAADYRLALKIRGECGGDAKAFKRRIDEISRERAA